MHVGRSPRFYIICIMRKGEGSGSEAPTRPLDMDRILPAPASPPQRYGDRSLMEPKDLIRPPCWPNGQTCPNECAAAYYQRIIYNHTSLSGPWAGWKLTGRDLVSPRGVRVSPQRMEGLIWRQEAEQRLQATRARNEAKKAGLRGMVTVLRMPLSDWHLERFGSRAG